MNEKVNIEHLLKTKDEKDRIFLKAAYDYAFHWSEDDRTKTGAIISINYVAIAKGRNHFKKGTENIPDRTDPLKKHIYIRHAEDDAVIKAKETRKGLGLAVMHMFWIPCTPCYNIVRDSGIKKMVVHKELIEKTPERWIKNLNETIELAEKDKFQIIVYEGKIGYNTKSLFNGIEWNP